MLLIFLLITACSANYWQDREAFIEEEKSLSYGSSQNLTSIENLYNKFLLQFRIEEYDEGFKHPEKFAPGRHFFDAKEDIDNSKVFELLNKMPKGGFLHGHDTALGSYAILYKLTFMDGLYGCVNGERLKLKFFEIPASDCNWKLISEMRKEAGFDDWLKTQMTLVIKNHKEVYTDINKVWSAFSNTFATNRGMLSYVPAFKMYLKEVLKEYFEDGIIYMEIRATLSPLYDFNRTYNIKEVAGIYSEVIEEFKAENKDFYDTRLIYAPHRKVTNETIQIYKRNLQEIVAAYPKLIIGFDLVGQEDLGNPLIQFVEDLQSFNLSFYFHAGETNWYGADTDNNVIDAILLNTTRIGHGYALSKHPKALKLAKDRNIAIEVSPISNQVLKLIEDLRNHPAIGYLAEDYPVVICSDDPGLWGAKTLSYDWYAAFMGFGRRDSDLKMLKQFAINSLEFSSLKGEELKNVIEMWQKQWNAYLSRFIQDEMLC